MTLPTIPDVKTLREALCVAQHTVADLIRLCDRLRPLGSDGKHGDRHTPYCGCDDALAVASLPAPEPPWQPIEPGTVIKAGTRYRRICAAERVAAKDFAAGEGYSVDSRTVLDPDAALVEAIGSVLTHYEGGKWGPESVAILAAIRETHTIEPKPAAGPLGGAR